MILMREKRTSSRSRDHHGLFFMSKQRMCVWARRYSVVRSRHILLTPFSVLCTQAPIAIATCLETLSDGCSSGSSRKRKQEVWDVVIHYIKLNLVIAVSLM